MVCANLDDGVMDVEGGHGEAVFLGELVETVDSCHTLFYHTSHVLGGPRELGQEAVSGVSPIVQYHGGLPTSAL